MSVIISVFVIDVIIVVGATYSTPSSPPLLLHVALHCIVPDILVSLDGVAKLGDVGLTTPILGVNAHQTADGFGSMQHDAPLHGLHQV